MFGWILLGGVGFVVAFFVWGILRLRESQRVAYEWIKQVKLEDVDRLRKECEYGFKKHFSETLSLADYEGSAKILSARIDQHETLKKAFSRDDFYWYFVLPVGAYIGELLRVHAKGQWKETKGAGLSLEMPAAGVPMVARPFNKVMKQSISGDKGDLYAFFVTCQHLETVVAEHLARKT